MLILLCIWPFNFCHIAVKLLLWFQRVGHLVHCGEQSGPTCKIPARQVLRQELLHHSECKHLPTNCPRQMRCEIMQLILDLLCLILSRVLQFRRQLSWKPGFAATTCITGLGRRQKRCVLCCIHNGPSNHDYCLGVASCLWLCLCPLLCILWLWSPRKIVSWPQTRLSSWMRHWAPTRSSTGKHRVKNLTSSCRTSDRALSRYTPTPLHTWKDPGINPARQRCLGVKESMLLVSLK